MEILLLSTKLAINHTLYSLQEKAELKLAHRRQNIGSLLCLECLPQDVVHVLSFFPMASH